MAQQQTPAQYTKVLVFDTETTGLPDGRPGLYELKRWPHIVQLSYVLYDTVKNKILISNDHIIRVAPSVPISPKSIEMHGITRERSEREGIDIRDALDLFQVCATAADAVVAHNLAFDKKMIMVENIRAGFKNARGNPLKLFPKDDPASTRYCCTMKENVDFCQIRAVSYTGEEYYKYPRLNELYYKLFNCHPAASQLHNSMVDVLLCLRCFVKQEFNADLLLINPAFKRTINKYQIHAAA